MPILHQSMRLLAPVLLSVAVFMVMGAGVSAFGESPTVSSTGDIVTASLLTPEFEVDTSEFGSTGEIILDVKFENPGSQRHGVTWNFESAYDENGLDDPIEVYEKFESQRMFFISIKDVTNEEKQKLNENQFVVNTNDQFIETRYNEKSADFEVEILDIDDLVPFTSSGKAKIETQLRLSSLELIAENDYEVLIWTNTRSVDPVMITLPSSTTPAPMEMPKNVEEFEKLQENTITDQTVEEIVPKPSDSQPKEIPEWVKGIFGFYAEGTIGDEELIGALQYLIKEGIIEV